MVKSFLVISNPIRPLSTCSVDTVACGRTAAQNLVYHCPNMRGPSCPFLPANKYQTINLLYYHAKIKAHTASMFIRAIIAVGESVTSVTTRYTLLVVHTSILHILITCCKKRVGYYYVAEGWIINNANGQWEVTGQPGLRWTLHSLVKSRNIS